MKQCPEIEELNCLYKAWDDVYHSAATKLGLSDSAFLIFYGLAELGDGCSQKDLAQHYSASKQTHQLFHQEAGAGGLSDPDPRPRPGPGRSCSPRQAGRCWRKSWPR